MARNKNAGKYQSIEKILHLANINEHGLNVAVGEKADTDLNVRVKKLVELGYLVNSGGDAENNYFDITEKGKIKLLKLQIEVRKKLGKSIDLHELELEELMSK